VLHGAQVERSQRTGQKNKPVKFFFHFSVVSRGEHFDVHLESLSASEAWADCAALFPEGEADVMLWED
jgi:hypothetical protein